VDKPDCPISCNGSHFLFDRDIADAIARQLDLLLNNFRSQPMLGTLRAAETFPSLPVDIRKRTLVSTVWNWLVVCLPPLSVNGIFTFIEARRLRQHFEPMAVVYPSIFALQIISNGGCLRTNWT
jgi:hypothetical protein